MKNKYSMHRQRDNAHTWSLVLDTCHAAQIAMHAMPRIDVPRNKAPAYAHALAAEIRYKEDGDTQVIKMPHALLDIGEGDCKSTAVYVAALGAAMGCDVQLRFIQYEPGPVWWQHVYTILDGIVCDPLLPLGEEFTYFRDITKALR